MSEISVIGLGEMGSAIARTLLENDYKVTVWNRTAEKAEKLAEEGAIVAKDAFTAVKTSPVIVTCVTTYDNTHSILNESKTVSALAGRTVIELSTGTPQNARDAETWVHAQGAEYLDGAIAATPSLLGRPDTPIFVSGAESVFRKNEAPLKILGGGLNYVGESIGAAAAWDLGFISYLWGTYLGFLHSARIFESENIRVDALGKMIFDISPVIGEMMKHESELIENGTFNNPQSSLEMCAASVDLILKQANDAGINSEIPTFNRKIFQKGVDAGYGKEGLAALIKILRENNHPKGDVVSA